MLGYLHIVYRNKQSKGPVLRIDGLDLEEVKYMLIVQHDCPLCLRRGCEMDLLVL